MISRPLDAQARADAEEIPYAMQIALRVEKSEPPNDLAACAAAATACVGLLDRAQTLVDEGDSSWLDAVDAWRGLAIRKIVRRCRGKRWDDAQALPGVTARYHNAEARAFIPAPAWPLPSELAKMQVEGTELPEGPATDDAYVTVRLTPLEKMTSGKSAAQCAHAAQRAFETMTAAEQTRWREDSFTVHVIRDSEENWANSPGRVSIVDAGFTELDGQHETTRADW